MVQNSTGSQEMLGKMLIPDLSGVAISQQQTLATMEDITMQSAATLQSVVQAQQDTLGTVLGNMQTSLQKALSKDMMGGTQPPFNAIQFRNMEQISEHFSQVTASLVASTGQSVDALTNSVTASMAKIEQTVIKFSGG